MLLKNLYLLRLEHVEKAIKTIPMQRVKALLLVLFMIGLSSWAVSAQTAPCVYTLELQDTQGDGWNGARLQVRVNGVNTDYTLTNGSRQQFLLYFNNNDSLQLAFFKGKFDSEASYTLVDQENRTVFVSGSPFPLPGVVFRTKIVCPTCAPPPVSQIKIEDVRAFTSRISWLPNVTNGVYQVEYDTLGFRRGKGQVIRTPLGSLTLSKLKENKRYQFYLSVVCKPGDTSRVLGPYFFKTLWANDVGVSKIVAPLSSCGLTSADSVKVLIRNYGGNPQSLIPFDYAVNGKAAGVKMPADGLYTGIVSKDSAKVTVFDATSNFATPGEYLIESWTALKSDSLKTNDTTRVRIISVPSISTLPYFTNLESKFSGWLVDTNSVNSTWAFGAPNKRVLNQAFSGNQVWTTNLSGNYKLNEKSYLLSPCFNFTSIKRDPTFSFAMQLDLESCCDAAWVELSTDGGKSWAKLGATDSGINWYNDRAKQVWTGNGGFSGWFTASHPLPGTSTAKDVRLRMVLQSDFANSYEGIALDNFSVSVADRDFVGTDVRNTATDACGSTTDQVAFNVGNLSTAPVTAFNVAYRVNNGAVVTENVGNLSIPIAAKRAYTFRAPFNSSTPGRYSIKAWVVGEAAPLNDTAVYTFYIAYPLPYAENFERGGVPTDWVVDNSLVVNKDRGNTTFVLSANLTSSRLTAKATTPVFGPLAANDSLTFQYRIVNSSAGNVTPTDLSANDRIDIQVSSDCGKTFTTVSIISRANHVPSTALRRLTVKLGAYSGKYVQVRFLATWGQGDYWIDIDNINVIRCTSPFSNVLATASQSGIFDGTALVVADPYAGPYTYKWSNGATTKQLTGLKGGAYTVTVTDRFGCTDVQRAVVGTITGLNEVTNIDKVVLMPNPTSQTTLLQVQLKETANLQVQLINSMGQILYATQVPNTRRADVPLDLLDHPAGMYFVRLVSNGQQRVEKLVRY